MRRETVSLGLTRLLADAIALALTARPAAGLMPTLTIRLMSVAQAVGPGTVIADMTECNFNGYAPVTPASYAGPLNVPAPGRALLADADFIAGSGLVAPGQIAYGYYLTDSAGTPTVLYGGEVFAEPITFATPGDSLALDLYLPCPFGLTTGLDA